jgi:hypothetical protein
MALAASGLLAGAAHAADPSDERRTEARPVMEDAMTFDTDQKTDRETYLTEWRNSVEDWSQAVRARSEELSDEAADRMQSAWRSVQARWETLEEETGERWDRARDSFEDAFAAFARTWNSGKDDGGSGSS